MSYGVYFTHGYTAHDEESRGITHQGEPPVVEKEPH